LPSSRPEDERFILERHDVPEKREYVRFVIGRKDEHSHVEQGIFQAAARVLEWYDIAGSDADELNELRGWFSENLERPTSFGRNKLRLGICWFKTDSAEHISRIWKMVRILERNGIYVKKITTDKPGYLNLRRRMATRRRTLPQRHNTEELGDPVSFGLLPDRVTAIDTDRSAGHEV